MDVLVWLATHFIGIFQKGATVFSGLVIGIVPLLIVLMTAVYALTRLIGTLLYGVRPTDLPSFAAAALTLVLVALAACLFPASRASRIAPAVALRNE